MPLYEYRCQSCGRTREVLQKMSDAPLTVCEDCGGEMKRLVSAPAVQFKGTGWYVTDYAKKSDGGGRSGGDKDKDREKDKDKSGGESGVAAEKPAAEKPAAAADAKAAPAAPSSGGSGD